MQYNSLNVIAMHIRSFNGVNLVSRKKVFRKKQAQPNFIYHFVHRNNIKYVTNTYLFQRHLVFYQ
ncbi:UNVERIFIED_CONTAM: hypothetical protein NCL1_20341 [Trichonephila clavipes]